MGSREKFPVTVEYQVELDNRYAPLRCEADLLCLLGGRSSIRALDRNSSTSMPMRLCEAAPSVPILAKGNRCRCVSTSPTIRHQTLAVLDCRHGQLRTRGSCAREESTSGQPCCVISSLHIWQLVRSNPLPPPQL